TKGLACHGLLEGERPANAPVVIPVVSVAFRWFSGVLLAIRSPWRGSPKMQKPLHLLGTMWSEREDLNLRPLVSQTSALTGLRHAPMPFHYLPYGLGARPASPGEMRTSRHPGDTARSSRRSVLAPIAVGWPYCRGRSIRCR